MKTMDHDAMESHDRQEWQAAIKSREREDDEDHSEEEADEARIDRINEIIVEGMKEKQHMSIYAKLLQFQELGITLKKDGSNPHFNSSYVTLNEVLDKVKKPLNKLGILIVQKSELNGLVTQLVDTDNDSKVESIMPYVELATAQKLGSNITYLRRYSLIALLGLEDQDDDGNSASVSEYVRSGETIVQVETASPLPKGPSCVHGTMRRVQVRKAGPNKGRWFFACPMAQGKQCDSFKWADEWTPEAEELAAQLDETPDLGEDGIPF